MILHGSDSTFCWKNFQSAAFTSWVYFSQFSEYVLFWCQSKDPEVHISAQPLTPSSSLDFSEERALTYIRSPAWEGAGTSLNIPGAAQLCNTQDPASPPLPWDVLLGRGV